MSTKSYSVTAFPAIKSFLNSKVAPMIIKTTPLFRCTKTNMGLFC